MIKYPIEKVLLIVGVLYMIFGGFGIIDYLDDNESDDKQKVFSKIYHLDKLNFSISKRTSNFSSDTFFKFFKKENTKNNLFDDLIPIAVGLILISLENFFH